MAGSLEGQNAFITGGGSGMGRELVLELLRRGARVAAVDVNAKTLAETASLAAERANDLATFTADISDRAAVETLVRSVLERFGAVDGLINCAGIIQPFVRVRDLDYSMIDRIFGTYHMPDEHWPLKYGTTKPLPSKFVDQALYPFRSDD